MDFMDYVIWVVIGVCILFVVGLFILAVIPAHVGLDRGHGKQIGYIAEIEESGMIWRPPEVRLLNIITTMSDFDTSWHYAIEPELLEVARSYQKSNTPVEVEYEVHRWVWYWDYSTREVITNISPLNKTE